MPEYHRIAIIGLGLIGGSIALALRSRYPDIRITGHSLSDEDAAAALRSGALDAVAATAQEAAQDAQIAVLATSPASIAPLIRELAESHEDLLLTDTGSVKQAIVTQLKSLPAALRERIVPAHPIAGREFSGFRAADADLFQGRNAVLTPLDGAEACPALQRIEGFWQLLGCRTLCMDAEEHDAIFAGASHLPHLVAWALTAAIDRHPGADRVYHQGAGGLQSLVRIAASDPQLWAEISSLNKDSLRSYMEEFSAVWQQIKTLVEAGDQQKLQALMQRHRRTREAH